MKIYEIAREIDSMLNDVDPETGEVLFDTDKLENLQMKKDQKVENLALAIKDMTAEAKAIWEEEKALADRRKKVENGVKRARQYLEFILNGEPFKTPKVAISYRNSTKVIVDDDFLAWAKEEREDLLRYKDPEPDKSAITSILKSGETLPHAELITETNMQIK